MENLVADPLVQQITDAPADAVALVSEPSTSKRKPDNSPSLQLDTKRTRTDEPAQECVSDSKPSLRVPKTTVKAAASEDKGLRNCMEDVFVIHLDAGSGSECDLRLCHFSIFDGHGGQQAAAFASERLHSLAMSRLTTSCEVAKGGTGSDPKAVKTAIAEAFHAVDDALLKECAAKQWQDGATAVAVWVLGELVAVANVGDAKCVLARVSDKAESRGQLRAVTLTKEHMAIFPAERQRIEKSGGFVSKDGRLNGRMQVSRSFGDAQFKKCGCIVQPDITVFTLTERDKFMLLGCDGFWGVFEPQSAVDMAARLLAEGRDEKGVTNRLINEAIRERRCKDNCTVMLITFSQGGEPVPQAAAAPETVGNEGQAAGV